MLSSVNSRPQDSKTGVKKRNRGPIAIEALDKGRAEKRSQAGAATINPVLSSFHSGYQKWASSSIDIFLLKSDPFSSPVAALGREQQQVHDHALGGEDGHPRLVLDPPRLAQANQVTPAKGGMA